MDKRRRNVRAALENIIEKAGDVEVSATAVVSAVAAYAKINANGQWIERSEHISLNELFDRMTPQEMENYAANGTVLTWFEQEMENYAANGTVPTWFERTLGATPTNGQGGSNVQ
jgi:hypothetical protein